MKGLNLYAGAGGNRKLWTDINVTAIEWDQDIADIYQGLYQDDEVIVTDAHDFLLDNYQDFDFIWSSPPCPTHSHTNRFLHPQGVKRYPDMKLYEEIIILKQWATCPWVVENVNSYYAPLIKPISIGRHYFWSNFRITPFRIPDTGLSVINTRESTRRSKQEHLKSLQEYHGIDTDNLQALKNCVYPPLGQHILNCARGNTQQPLFTRDETKLRTK